MRPVHLSAESAERIRAHARLTYPDECCGFLISRADPPGTTGPRTVVEIEPAENGFDGERRRRFAIRPQELLAAEHRWEPSGYVIAGFYHSHPDHPARPSAFDQDHAWPWYTYVVVSVTASDTPASGAFELDEDSRRFHEVGLEVGPVAGPQVTENVRALGAR